MVYIVKYKADNTIEGYVEDEKGFDSWLSEYNKNREEEGATPEEADEFELIHVYKLD